MKWHETFKSASDREREREYTSSFFLPFIFLFSCLKNGGQPRRWVRNLLSLGELVEARKERELRRNKLVCYVNKLSASLVPLPPSIAMRRKK